MGFHCTCTALQPYLRITSHYNKFDTLFFIRTFFIRGQVLGGRRNGEALVRMAWAEGVWFLAVQVDRGLSRSRSISDFTDRVHQK